MPTLVSGPALLISAAPAIGAESANMAMAPAPPRPHRRRKRPAQQWNRFRDSSSRTSIPFRLGVWGWSDQKRLRKTLVLCATSDRAPGRMLGGGFAMARDGATFGIGGDPNSPNDSRSTVESTVES